MQKPNPLSENNRKLLSTEHSQEDFYLGATCRLFSVFILKEKNLDGYSVDLMHVFETLGNLSSV